MNSDPTISQAPIHLVKLCVGIASVAALADRQHEGVRTGRYAQPQHRTRNRPRRWQDLISGGSIYWVINGIIRVRQQITTIELLEVKPGDKPCVLTFSPVLILTRPRPVRPFQGWRYLAAADAPPDIGRLERHRAGRKVTDKNRPDHQR